MSMITIDRDVPFPSRHKYPWSELRPVREIDGNAVGDSFLFPSNIKRANALSMSHKAGKQLGRKFSIRMMKEGIRVWRTE